MVGDFCVDPNTHVVVLLSETDHPAGKGLLEYYTKGCTTRNTAIETLSAAQDTARGVIEPSLETLWEVCDCTNTIFKSVQPIHRSMRLI